MSAIPCVCFHAPEQHGDRGCMVLQTTGEWCPCGATRDSMRAESAGRRIADRKCNGCGQFMSRADVEKYESRCSECA